jgi:two-component system, NarL family, response regulator LiaR
MSTALGKTSRQGGRQETVRIAVVAGDSFIRRGLQTLLADPGLIVVGEAATLEGACEIVLKTAPHVVVIDPDGAGVGGTHAVRRLSDELPLAQLVVLTSRSDEESVFGALAAGASGYLRKASATEEIQAAVWAAFDGASHLSPEITSMVLGRLRPSRYVVRGRRSSADLTERELDVLRLVSEGRDNQEIAASLLLSASTVKSHISNILTKLHLRNRIQAAVYAAEHDLL